MQLFPFLAAIFVAVGSWCFGEERLLDPFETWGRPHSGEIADAVNLCTGTYVHRSIDVSIEGCAPLYYGHFHTRDNTGKNSLREDRISNHECVAEPVWKWGDYFISLYDDSGRRLHFKTPLNHPKDERFTLIPADKGLVYRGYSCSWDKGLGVITLRQKNGTTSIWRQGGGGKSPYLLRSVQRPNGVETVYSYEGDKLSRIANQCHATRQELNWLALSHDSNSTTVSSCTGETVKYRFDTKRSWLSKQYRLKDVQNRSGTTHRYHYDDKGLNAPQVSMSTETGLGGTEVHYVLGGPEVLGRPLFFGPFAHPDQGRVHKLKTLVGADGRTTASHSFEYHKRSTDVVNDRGNLTRFHHCYGDIWKIEYFFDRAGRALIGQDRFFWGKEEKQGLLLAKDLRTPSDKIEACFSYDYDAVGNLTRETFYGNLSGGQKGYLERANDEAHPKSGGESFSRTFTYSTDGLNNRLSMSESTGRSYTYRYVPGTSLLEAQFEYDHGSPVARTFFRYNALCQRVEV
ncbi:MAG: hypothetical protein KDK78_00110, partial [Chlamydiia bacterium]|nr:hypothetical protein [Chlamydiia bacterium]